MCIWSGDSVGDCCRLFNTAIHVMVALNPWKGGLVCNSRPLWLSVHIAARARASLTCISHGIHSGRIEPALPMESTASQVEVI